MTRMQRIAEKWEFRWGLPIGDTGWFFDTDRSTGELGVYGNQVTFELEGVHWLTFNLG